MDRPPLCLARAVISAPRAAAMARTMDRPRPWPLSWWTRRPSSRQKGWNSRPTASGGMAGPVLATARTARPSLAAVLTSMLPPATL
jgi:hypothetical protein